MTLLLNLPLELFQEVLLQAVLVRSPIRALRLRLVCKKFSQQVQFVLFQRQLLDDCFFRYMMRLEWNHCEPATFWHSYFSQRTLNTENPPHVNFHVIGGRHYHVINHTRMIAERICEETDIDLKTAIEALCWLAMYQAYHFSDDTRQSGLTSDNLEADLFSAAAYLNLVPMTRRLLQADDCLEEGVETFFPSPIILPRWQEIQIYLNFSEIIFINTSLNRKEPTILQPENLESKNGRQN
ncbi:1b42d6b5-7938-4a69-a42f-9deaf034bb30 [Sclerotinia trifoliorum]|uniref:1b42d6b5-7938-4a69-a42f-9deaf034bb30 n=1 Tax=Sclerotinia trifoliorum TaxID=28548 RepID=A0A8H2ZUN5_9HELO|nr:1b42d6b5-7938-4a69-a42f-9deaf034bb30 [Sclerotinia trifoliorum]